MADVLRAMSIAGGILLTIVGFIVVATFAAVKRGEAQMQGGPGPGQRVWWNMGPSAVAAGAGGTAVIGAGPAAKSEISVIQILVLGTGLFVLAVLGLLGLSIIQHL